MKRYFILWCLVLSVSFLHADGFMDLIDRYKTVGGVEYRCDDLSNIYMGGESYIYNNERIYLSQEQLYEINEKINTGECAMLDMHKVKLNNVTTAVKTLFIKELKRAIEKESVNYIKSKKANMLLKCDDDDIYTLIEYYISDTECNLTVLRAHKSYIHYTGLYKFFIQ